MEELQQQIEELSILVENLTAQVNEIDQRLDNYENSSMMPYNLEQSIKERIRPVTAESPTTTAQSRSLSLTGEAENITISVIPSGILPVKYKEKVYNLLFK